MESFACELLESLPFLPLPLLAESSQRLVMLALGTIMKYKTGAVKESIQQSPRASVCVWSR